MLFSLTSRYMFQPEGPPPGFKHIYSSPGSFPGAAGSPAASFPRQHLQQQPLGLPGSPGQSKYGQLLAVIEETGKDIRPTYAGSKRSAVKLKRGIVHTATG